MATSAWPLEAFKTERCGKPRKYSVLCTCSHLVVVPCQAQRRPTPAPAGVNATPHYATPCFSHMYRPPQHWRWHATATGGGIMLFVVVGRRRDSRFWTQSRFEVGV
jgi:hypothetical protein